MNYKRNTQFYILPQKNVKLGVFCYLTKSLNSVTK